MEKNQNFFDPYNFNTMPPIPSHDMPTVEMANPNMYYEQQFMYYKYLTQMLEYKIKLKEWEKLNDKK